MSDIALSKFLYGVCMIAVTVLTILIIAIPWGVPILLENSPLYTEAYHQTTIMGLLYLTGIPAWGIVWFTKGLAKNIIDRKPFSEISAKKIKRISLCALLICIEYTLSLVVLPIGITLCIIIIGSFMVALIGTILYKLVKQAMQIQEENELTI